MTHPVLYSFRRCPYAMRARLALMLSETLVEMRDILLKDKPQQMLDESPKGTVPVLVLNDGTVIDESLDIVNWALKQNDPHNLIACDEQLQLVLIEQNDTSFKKALDRYKYPNRYPDEQNIDWRAEAEVFLAFLDKQLSTQPYLMGDVPSMADICIFPFIRQFRKVDEVWFDHSAYQNVLEWLTKWTKSALYTAVMEKYPQWKYGQTPVTFPMNGEFDYEW